jgi:hypothetical protein
MGQEASAKLHRKGRDLDGAAQLESDHILFRGAERAKFPLKDLRDLTAADGELRFVYQGEAVTLTLGPAAAKWEQKILHPPTLLDKLGVKPGARVALVGAFDAAFVHDLGDSAGAKPAAAELILLSAPDRKTLSRLPALARAMRPDAGLWVVYPKAIPAIREIEVINAGREAGLKDVKVASFSSTHTALKFVIPVAARARTGRPAR